MASRHHLDRSTALDAGDELADFRHRFVGVDDLVYLTGNSLGRLPVATRDRLRDVVDREWGHELASGWDLWMSLARQAGDLLADLMGVSRGEVVLSDSTTVNLFKLAEAALAAQPGRRVIVTSADNFSSDRYVLAGIASAHGMTLRSIEPDAIDGVSVADVVAAVDTDVALVSLSHVAFRSGARADLIGITAAVHDAGALMLWDVSHSIGAVDVPLGLAGADLAVGCTYKYLNGGPGGPAFLFVRSDLQAQLRQPIWGWFSQRDQFAMGADYLPVDGVERFLVGTPPVLAGYAALEGIRLTKEAGVEAIERKAAALTDYAIDLADYWLAPYGVTVFTPRRPQLRGASLSLSHQAARDIVGALRPLGVITDFREPNLIRMGLAPLYTRFGDVHRGFSRLHAVLQTLKAVQGASEP